MLYPKISIITPSYNQGQFIEQTILSVINQNYPNLEYIIIDGGSTDKSVEIIKKYEKHLAYWVSEPDKGQSDAINKGIAKCTGDIFNWINSDDYYEPNVFNEIAEGFKDKNTLALCGFMNRVNMQGNVLNKVRTQIYDSFPQTVGYLLYQQLSTFIRFSAVRKLGVLNTNLNYAMDIEWWFKFLLKFGIDNIKMTNQTITNFRVYPNSKTGSSNSQLFNELINIYYHFFENTLDKQTALELIKVTKADIMNDYHPEIEFSSCSNPQAKQILNFFTIHKAEISYGNSNFSDCLNYLSLIDLGIASSDLKKSYQKLHYRAKYLFPIIYLKQKLNS